MVDRYRYSLVVFEAVSNMDDFSMPRVWVCLGVFNRLQYTRKCLELLQRQSYQNVRPVIVDDGSTDGTSAMVRAEFPDVVLLHGDGSLYWTGTMHVGVAHILSAASPGDYVLLLNDDLIFGLDLVERFVRKSEENPRALIQAVECCINTPDLIWQGGVKINWWTAKHRPLNYHCRLSGFDPGHQEDSDYLTARGVIVPFEVLLVVGNYDNTYQQSGDPEFTRRAAKKGFALKVAYDIVVFSYEKGKNLNEADEYSLSDVKRYYFGILSNFRLSTRWKQAKAMTNSGIQALIFFAFDFARITVHLLKRLKFA